MDTSNRVFRAVRRHRGRLLALVAGLALTVGAQAQTIQHSNFPPNPGVLPGGGWKFTSGTTFGSPPPPRTWTNGVYGARTLDALTLAGRGGPLAVTAATTMTWPAVGRAVASCLALANPYCLAVSAAAAVYASVRIAPDGAGGLTRDPGISPVSGNESRFRTFGQQSTVSTTKDGACALGRTYYQTTSGVSLNYTLQTFGDGSTACRLTRVSNGDFYIQASVETVQVQVSGCPASIDASNPAYNVPAGSPIGPDGKCPSARYNHTPITPEGAAGYFPTSGGAQPQQAAQDAIASGQTIPGTVSASGPTSQQGPTTTSETTGPSGVTTTTKTPTYSYVYNGDTITFGPVTTITNITNNEGSTTTTEVSEQKPQETDCDKYPSSLGCAEFGPIPEAPDVAASSITVAFTKGTGWGADDAACPANLALPNSWGVPLTFDYGPVCTYVSGLRFVIIGLAWIAALYIFMGWSRED